MSNATNPFDLLSSLEKEKPKKSAKGPKVSSQPVAANGDSAAAAGQKKRRAKATKVKAARDEAQKDGIDPQLSEVTNLAEMTSSGDKLSTGSLPVDSKEPAGMVTPEEAAAFLADSSGKIDPALLAWADIDIKAAEEEFKVVGKSRQGKGKASSAGPPSAGSGTAATAVGALEGVDVKEQQQADGHVSAPRDVQGSAEAGQIPAREGRAPSVDVAPGTSLGQPSGSLNPHGPPGWPQSQQEQEQERRELEETARLSWSWEPRARTQLWKQWMIQAQMPSLPDGKPPWKQLFVTSDALEITLQGCLHPPLPPSILPDLQLLLSTFLLAAPESAPSIAQLTHDLSQVIACQPGSRADPNLLQSVREALGASVSCLKRSPSGWAVHHVAASLQDESVQQSLLALNSTASHIESQLGHAEGEANASGSVDKASHFKELAAIGQSRLSTLLGSISRAPGKEKAAAVQSAPAPGAGADSAPPELDTWQVQALERVRGLTSLILQRKREGPAPSSTSSSTSVGNNGSCSSFAQGAGQARPPQGLAANHGAGSHGSGESANGVDSSAAAEVEELQKSVEAAEADAFSLRNQLKEAERTVSRLRDMCLQAEMRHKELEQRLTIKKSQDSHDVSTVTASNGEAEQTPAQLSTSAHEVPAHSFSQEEQHQLMCARQLGAVHALETLLLRRPIVAEIPADSEPRSPEEAAVWGALAHAVTEHLRALASLLHSLHAQLQGAGQRLRFCQEKMQKIKEDMGKYKAMGRAQMVDSLAKPLESAEGLYRARRAELEAILKEANAVEASLHQADLRTAVALLPLLPPVHLLLQQIGTTLHQIRKEHIELVESEGTAAAPSAASAAAASALALAQGKGKAAQDPHRGAGGLHSRKVESAGKVVGFVPGRGRGKKATKDGQQVPTSALESAALPFNVHSEQQQEEQQLRQEEGQQKRIMLEEPKKSAWQKPIGATGTKNQFV